MRHKDPGAFYAWLSMHGVTEAHLERIARAAWETHVALRNARYGTADVAWGPVDKAWVEIAMRIVECNTSPAAYISVFWHESRDPPLNVMKSVKAAQGVRAKLVDREAMIRQAVQLQSQRLLAWRREGSRSLRDMLMDTRGQFEPAFVYCVARWEGLGELEKTHERRAMDAFLDPATRRVFSEAFPEVLKGVV